METGKISASGAAQLKDLPAPEQISSRWSRPPELREAVDLLEWVRDETGLALLDHGQGEVRESSRAATYRRRSTVRTRASNSRSS